MILKKTSLLFACVCAACFTAPVQKTVCGPVSDSTTTMLVKAPGFQGVILDTTTAGTFDFHHFKTKWFPSCADIFIAESLLADTLKKCPPKQGPKQALKKYRRQYFGFVHEGDSCVFVNLFWTKNQNDLPDWTREPVMFPDAVPDFWSISIDLKNQRAFDLIINRPE